MAENDRRKSRSYQPDMEAAHPPRPKRRRSGAPASPRGQTEASRKGTSIARKKPRKKPSPKKAAAKKAATALKKKAQKELDKLSRRTVTKTAAPKKKPANRRHLGSPVVRSPLKKRYR